MHEGRQREAGHERSSNEGEIERQRGTQDREA